MTKRDYDIPLQESETGNTAFLQARGLGDIKLTGSVKQVLEALHQQAHSRGSDARNENWQGENGMKNIVFLAVFSDRAREAGMKPHDIRTAIELMAEHIDKGKKISEVASLADGVWQASDFDRPENPFKGSAPKHIDEHYERHATRSPAMMTSMRAPFSDRAGKPVRFTVPVKSLGASLRSLVEDSAATPVANYLKPSGHSERIEKESFSPVMRLRA